MKFEVKVTIGGKTETAILELTRLKEGEPAREEKSVKGEDLGADKTGSIPESRESPAV